MTEWVEIEHPDITSRARVARTALPYLDPRWQVVGEQPTNVESEQPPGPDPADQTAGPGPDGATINAPQAHNRPRRTA